ncbi:hypothetical protein ABZX77_15010 [Streptomyces sp. NPDC004237]|uniref:hypothetical protein n=1 Tax=Streptomyces sp. NPDC004237 TaxID=3154455 RepID=UPI0033B2D31B
MVVFQELQYGISEGERAFTDGLLVALHLPHLGHAIRLDPKAGPGGEAEVDPMALRESEQRGGRPPLKQGRPRGGDVLLVQLSAIPVPLTAGAQTPDLGGNLSEQRLVPGRTNLLKAEASESPPHPPPVIFFAVLQEGRWPPGPAWLVPPVEPMTWGVVPPGPRGAVGDADERPDYRPVGRNARHLVGGRSA